MTEEQARSLQALIDRQDISDCLLRYCRGVDRLDRDLMLSAYHDDAIDDHGVVVLRAAAFSDWAIDYHKTQQTAQHHVITNSSIELEDTTAHAETYYLFLGSNRQKPDTIAFGRYIDRLEKRHGRWGIVARQCITESVHQIDAASLPPQYMAALTGNGPASRDLTDISYQRPLRVTRPCTE